jgi:cytochrome P450
MLPPGPKSRFLVGNFPLRRRDPLGLLTRWAREFGDVIYYRAFNFPVYFLNHPDHFEYVLVTNTRNFIKGRGFQANRAIFGNGLLISEGDFWLRQRRLAQPAFHRDRIAAYAETMVAYTERMLGTWREGETRDVHLDMMRLTLEVVAKCLFDFELAAELEVVGSALEAFMQQNRSGRMLLPILGKLPTPGNLRYRHAVRRLDRMVYDLIRRRRASGKGRGDLLTMLLEAEDVDGSRMTDQQLRDETVNLMLAGHETTALALSWTWYLLSQHPEVEGRLWKELDEVLGGRAPTVEDVPRLVYTDRIVKESLRLYPPVYAMPRIALEDCKIGGYDVKAGASIVISQWVAHRDPRYYDDPERFSPDRWADGLEKRLPKFTYFPFGGGPRLCIGQPFAMMEAVLLLSTIAQRYQLRLAPKPPVEVWPTMTLRPKHGVHVVLVKRAPRLPDTVLSAAKNLHT